jgi:predicted metalloendopeptidase
MLEVINMEIDLKDLLLGIGVVGAVGGAGVLAYKLYSESSEYYNNSLRIQEEMNDRQKRMLKLTRLIPGAKAFVDENGEIKDSEEIDDLQNIAEAFPGFLTKVKSAKKADDKKATPPVTEPENTATD